ncbi:hypothetical protein CDL12_10006 [Handroanthus impetiginosus]|uniref:Cytochrome b561 domain-containing protein n=1 Tax=Handroanthus impetiginosus TaxID=429701 RepID=A0A2G9HIL1_9LAMI|nr:hypothetical protein CDL12_10006 [Handroanthus impetiginosus]
MEEIPNFGLLNFSFLFVVLISFMQLNVVVEGGNMEGDGNNALSHFFLFPAIMLCVTRNSKIRAVEFSRPSMDSKYRRYWNWYHNWTGRITLFFRAVNIVLGIHIAGAGQAWKIGYGFLVGSVLVTVIVFEALLRVRRSEERKTHPPFPMNSIEQEISL